MSYLKLIFLFLILNCSYAVDNERFQPATTAKEHLAKASTAQTVQERQIHQLSAVKALLAHHHLDQAEQLLFSIEKNSDAYVEQQKKILLAELYLAKQQPQQALVYVQRLGDISQLTVDTQADYYQIAAETYRRNNNLGENVIARINLMLLQPNKYDTEETRAEVFRDLQRLPIERLLVLQAENSAPTMLGWLDLAVIAKQFANQPIALVNHIKQWQRKYPVHSAQKMWGDDATLNEVVAAAKIIPRQVALLLPLSGAQAKSGKDFLDGFKAAFNTAENGEQIAVIKVYDVNYNNVMSQYRRAINDGARLVIGPMTKSAVEQLSEVVVPTLALNYTEQKNYHENLLQFGLSLVQEGEEVAKLAWQKGKGKILIVTPNNVAGNKTKQAFVEQWQQLGGTIAGSLTYATKVDFAEQVAAFLHVENFADKVNKNNYSGLRRKDFDSVFLVADPDQAKQLEVLLQKNYAKENIPIFATSSVYHDSNHAPYYEVKNLLFVDLPWILKNDVLVHALRYRARNKNNVASPMYALGVDSYRLALLFKRLQLLPNFAIDGVTGQILLNNNQQIYRQLPTIKLVDGRPKRLMVK